MPIWVLGSCKTRRKTHFDNHYKIDETRYNTKVKRGEFCLITQFSMPKLADVMCSDVTSWHHKLTSRRLVSWSAVVNPYHELNSAIRVFIIEFSSLAASSRHVSRTQATLHGSIAPLPDTSLPTLAAQFTREPSLFGLLVIGNACFVW